MNSMINEMNAEIVALKNTAAETIKRAAAAAAFAAPIQRFAVAAMNHQVERMNMHIERAAAAAIVTAANPTDKNFTTVIWAMEAALECSQWANERAAAIYCR